MHSHRNIHYSRRCSGVQLSSLCFNGYSFSSHYFFLGYFSGFPTDISVVPFYIRAFHNLVPAHFCSNSHLSLYPSNTIAFSFPNFSSMSYLCAFGYTVSSVWNVAPPPIHLWTPPVLLFIFQKPVWVSNPSCKNLCSFL